MEKMMTSTQMAKFWGACGCLPFGIASAAAVDGSSAAAGFGLLTASCWVLCAWRIYESRREERKRHV